MGYFKLPYFIFKLNFKIPKLHLYLLDSLG